MGFLFSSVFHKDFALKQQDVPQYLVKIATMFQLVCFLKCLSLIYPSF